MGLELELLSAQLPPIRTAAAARRGYGGGGGVEEDVADCAVVVHHDEVCGTPTSAANVLRAPSVCPPAPRKPRPRPVAAKRKKKHARRCYSGRRGVPAQYWSFVAVPNDLAKVFVPRRPPSTSMPCRPPDGEKIRVHAVAWAADR